MSRHIMFDFETLGVGHLALPTRLSAIVFDPEKVNTVDDFRNGQLHVFDAFFDLEQLVKMGFRIKNSTIIFWNKLAWIGCLPDYEKDMRPVEEVMRRFHDFCDSQDINHSLASTYLWARGSDFDKSILDALCELAGLGTNYFPYNCARDIRTLFHAVYDSANAPEVKHPDLIKHNPVHDCVVQLIQTQQALAQIRGWRNLAQVHGIPGISNI